MAEACPPMAENHLKELQSTLPLPHVIVSLGDFSQHYLEEIQKDILSKTVRSTDRLWPDITERLSDFWGGGACGKQPPPKCSVLQCGSNTETFKRGTEVRLETWQGPGAHMHECMYTASLQTKNSEG